MQKLNIFFWTVAFLCCMSGCMEEEEYTYQLSDDKIIAILTDLHISESAAQHLLLSSRDSMVMVYLNQILEIHEVPIEVFEAEYLMLKGDPQKLTPIYDQIIKRLNDLKLTKKKEKPLGGQKTKQRVKKK